jgi:hypothetical protein
MTEQAEVELVKVGENHFETPNGEFSIEWKDNAWYVQWYDADEDGEEKAFWLTASVFWEAIAILESEFSWQMGGNRAFVLPDGVDEPKNRTEVRSAKTQDPPLGARELFERRKQNPAMDEKVVAEIRALLSAGEPLGDYEEYLDDPLIHPRIADLFPPPNPPAV